MRALLVRIAAWFATALLTASSADFATESAENLGWLGGSARDGHQETILPVLLIGIAVALALAAYVACTRMSGHDLWLLQSRGNRAQIVGTACALIGSALCIIAMERHETRFGGLSPFDAQSVVVTHAPALLAAFTIVAVAIQSAMRELLRAAERAGEAAASIFIRFVRKLPCAASSPDISHAAAIAFCVLHRTNPVADGGSALRAPPPNARLRLIIA